MWVGGPLHAFYLSLAMATGGIFFSKRIFLAHVIKFTIFSDNSFTSWTCHC